LEFQFERSEKFPDWIEICKKTGVHRFLPASTRNYDSSYFLSEYKNQYNKTYFEDEINLRSIAKQRLDLLKRIFPGKQDSKNPLRLLEIGSATGFFLDEARKLGYEAQGIEISEEASEYALKNLKLDIWKGSFVDFPENGKFDVIASFFTLEHMSQIEAIWQKIANLLKPGGAILVAFPSFYGPTFQTNAPEWFKTHPEDHFFDYDPRSIQKLLKELNFDVVFQMPLSFHPNRDRGWRGRLPLSIYKWISKITCYGDTMQTVAKKKN
jgi:SAM-dependent methyltransferase